jgi:hypothetical protein
VLEYQLPRRTVGDEASEPETRTEADEWQPPRELVVLVAGLIALGCAILLVTGRHWTAPTLGVVYLLGVSEAIIAVVFAVRCGISEHRRQGVFVPGVAVTALGTISLAVILVLSGVI